VTVRETRLEGCRTRGAKGGEEKRWLGGEEALQARAQVRDEHEGRDPPHVGGGQEHAGVLGPAVESLAEVALHVHTVVRVELEPAHKTTRPGVRDQLACRVLQGWHERACGLH